MTDVCRSSPSESADQSWRQSRSAYYSDDLRAPSSMPQSRSFLVLEASLEGIQYVVLIVFICLPVYYFVIIYFCLSTRTANLFMMSCTCMCFCRRWKCCSCWFAFSSTWHVTPYRFSEHHRLIRSSVARAFISFCSSRRLCSVGLLTAAMHDLSCSCHAHRNHRHSFVQPNVAIIAF